MKKMPSAALSKYTIRFTALYAFFATFNALAQIPYINFYPPMVLRPLDPVPAPKPRKHRIVKKHKAPLSHNVSAIHKTEALRPRPTLRQKQVSPLQIRPIVGYSFLNPKSLNNRLEQMARASGAPGNFNIKGAPQFALALDYNVAKGFNLGIRLEYFAASTDSIYAGNQNAGFTMQAKVQALPLLATATYLHPLTTNTRVGATVGAGMPLLYKTSLEFRDSKVAGTPDGTLAYSSFPFTAITNVCAEYGLTRKMAFRIEGGYQYLTSDSLTLNEPYGSERVGSFLRDSSGTNLEVNSSAITTSVSLVVTL